MPSVGPAPDAPRAVAREFQDRVARGMRLAVAGSGGRDPKRLLRTGYAPRFKLELFDVVYYLSGVRQNEDVRFFVGWVVERPERRRATRAHARIFYKDVSLIWRVASHLVRSRDENWIGKGAVKSYREDGEEVLSSDESTTDLPLEVQTGFEELARRTKRIPHDEVALSRILRCGPDDRLAPYQDFSAPRERARSDPRNLVNHGRRVAWFGRRGEPSSLRFARGFEPDFDRPPLETSRGTSSLYGGTLRRFRVLSRNRRIQYLFMASPRHAWIIPPQATTTEIMSYGVRTVDVEADDDLFVPGYEYHFLEEGPHGLQLYSQIPRGFAGPAHPKDPSRADASPWLERLPVIREFRRKLLRRHR